MKMTSLAFIEAFLTEELKGHVRACILGNGKQPDQPRKWHPQLPEVPSVLGKSEGVDETIWVLIRYEGTFECMHFEYSQNLCQEVVQTPTGIQRAIKIDLTFTKSVAWKLFQNTASDIKFKDVKQGIRTFKK